MTTAYCSVCHKEFASAFTDTILTQGSELSRCPDCRMPDGSGPWRELVAAQEDFIALLTAEYREMATIAHVHGYRSSRLVAGAKARQRMAKARRDVGLEAAAEQAAQQEVQR